MRACDRCKQEIRMNNATIKIKGKNYELCDFCLGEIEYYIKKGVEKQNPLKKLFG